MHTSESTKLREGVSNTFLHIAEISFLFCSILLCKYSSSCRLERAIFGGGGKCGHCIAKVNEVMHTAVCFIDKDYLGSVYGDTDTHSWLAAQLSPISRMCLLQLQHSERWLYDMTNLQLPNITQELKTSRLRTQLWWIIFGVVHCWIPHEEG